MRVVADTNVLVSAFLWTGLPHRVLRLAESRDITLYTSPTLIEELSGVLVRPRFAPRLQRLRVAAEELVAAYLALAHVILPPSITPTILEDPDDDAVLACALAAEAAYLISGDLHLLTLQAYRSIRIVSPATFFLRWSRQKS